MGEAAELLIARRARVGGRQGPTPIHLSQADLQRGHLSLRWVAWSSARRLAARDGLQKRPGRAQERPSSTFQALPKADVT